MAEVIVTPVPEGSARSRHTFYLGGFDGALGQIAGRGTAAGAGTVGSNWGFSGEGNSYLNSYQGTWVTRYRGGCQELLNVRAPIQVQRPPFKKWYPLPQLHVLALLLGWNDNTWLATEDNGLIISYQDVPQILAGGAARGFEIHNNGGTISLSYRGAAGVTTTVALSTVADPITPNLMNLFRIEMRQPVSDADGSLSVFVNDDAAPRAVISTADANWPLPTGGPAGLGFFIASASNTRFLFYRDVTYYHGPDTKLGM